MNSDRTGSRVVAWGSYLPEKILTNQHFESFLDTSDEWIVDRTGIKRRHIGNSTSESSIAAAKKAISNSAFLPEDFGALIISTVTPDKLVPPTSSLVHEELGLKCMAMDVNAACAGFVYALVTGFLFAKSLQKPVIVVGADTLSKITDYQDRSTAVLFGDGAGALILDPNQSSDSLIAYDLGVDGSAYDYLYCDHGNYLRMNGQEVFKRAVRAVVNSANKVLAQANLEPSDIKLFVPHQANARMVDAMLARLNIPAEKAALILEETGNTSSASIPLALIDAADRGMISEGDLILLSGFGAGMTWSSAILRW